MLSRLSSIFTLWFCASLLASTLFFAGAAKATDLDDFQSARGAYDARDFELSRRLFESLVGSEPPRLRSRPLVLESRKYLAATYIFLGRREAATHEFERLLHDEVTYELDPAQFPLEVVELFDAVRSRLRDERAAAEERRLVEERLLEERERNRRLIEFAETPTQVAIPNERWIAFIPFGVGQFQNGHEGWGSFFAVAEGLLFVSSAASLITHQVLVSELSNANLRDPGIVARGNDALVAAQVVNWASAGTFLVVALIGVVDANLRFVPLRQVSRPRIVPDSLRADRGRSEGRSDWRENVDFRLGPTSASLTVRF